MQFSRKIPISAPYRLSYTKSGLILPGQAISVWDPTDPTSRQMASYFTHPDQIPVSKGERLDNAVETAVTTVDKVIGYCRSGSVFPQTFGLACCAMEMIDVWNRIFSYLYRLHQLALTLSVLV